ncbi:MAG: hypothetical protein ACRC2B_20055 [Rubrivivax sp.]
MNKPDHSDIDGRRLQLLLVRTARVRAPALAAAELRPTRRA